MDICHVITTINRGGAENQLLSLVRQQVLDGHSVTVIPLKGNLELSNSFSAVGAIIESSISRLHWIFQPRGLRKLLRNYSGVVHAHLPRAEFFVSLACKKHDFITTRHNAEKFFPKSPGLISVWLSRFVSWRAFATICISKAVKEYFNLNNEIIGNCLVIYYGADLSNFDDSKRTKINSREFPASKNIILSVARLEAQKDLHTLLKSFAEISSNNNVVLLIVGSGSEEINLRNYAKVLQIDEKVYFLGQRSSLDELYASADVFVLTSKYEGFGLVLLEAMQSKIQIVASNNTAIPEVLGDSHPGLCQTGNYLDFASKITTMLSSANRDSVISYQNSQLRKFDIKITSKQHISCYSDMKTKVNEIYNS